MTTQLDPKYNTPPDDPMFLECKPASLSEAEGAYYLREGWKELFGEYPSNNSLAILWAQACLESGRFGTITEKQGKPSTLRNYNFGNVKRGSNPKQKYTSYLAGEYKNGVHRLYYSYHPETFFAAWDTALDGAKGYINFFPSRSWYKKAWAALLKGDPELFCVELKKGGYYTENVTRYTRTLKSIFNEFHRRSDELLSWVPPVEPVKLPPEPPVEPVVVPDGPVVVAPVEIAPGQYTTQEPPIEDDTPVEEKPVEIVDIVPIKNEEEKLNQVTQFFFMIWGYILQLINMFKGRK